MSFEPERRFGPRAPLGGQAVLQTGPNQQPCEIVDIGLTGMALLSTAAQCCGDFVRLSFRLGAPNTRLHDVDGVVVRAERKGTRNFFAIEFTVVEERVAAEISTYIGRGNTRRTVGDERAHSASAPQLKRLGGANAVGKAQTGAVQHAVQHPNPDSFDALVPEECFAGLAGESLTDGRLPDVEAKGATPLPDPETMYPDSETSFADLDTTPMSDGRGDPEPSGVRKRAKSGVRKRAESGTTKRAESGTTKRAESGTTRRAEPASTRAAALNTKAPTKLSDPETSFAELNDDDSDDDAAATPALGSSRYRRQTGGYASVQTYPTAQEAARSDGAGPEATGKASDESDVNAQDDLSLDRLFSALIEDESPTPEQTRRTDQMDIPPEGTKFDEHRRPLPRPPTANFGAIADLDAQDAKPTAGAKPDTGVEPPGSAPAALAKSRASRRSPSSGSHRAAPVQRSPLSTRAPSLATAAKNNFPETAPVTAEYPAATPEGAPKAIIQTTPSGSVRLSERTAALPGREASTASETKGPLDRELLSLYLDALREVDVAKKRRGR